MPLCPFVRSKAPYLSCHALPLAKKGAKSDLIELLLRVNGGGQISFEGSNGPIRLKVSVSEGGYNMSRGSVSVALSMEEVQKDLRRRYEKLGKN